MTDHSIRPPIDKDARFYVAGHRGLVGGAIWRALERAGHTNLIGASSQSLDLRQRSDVFDFFADSKPAHVVLAAARVGGIMANSTYPVEFLSDNLRIQVNVMDAALEHGVDRFLFLGSSCIYPKFAPQPISEDSLLTGHLERTNEAYAIAKIAGIVAVQSARREYGKSWISAMPTNLYGPGDNFSPTTSHVLPALIRRYEDARTSGAAQVTNWGTGRVRREFMHVDDMAAACLHLLNMYDDRPQVNVGTGTDLTVYELAALIAEVVGYRGRTDWDESKPDGTPQKLLDIGRLQAMDWAPSISLRQGLESTVAWYRENRDSLRQLE